MDAHAGDEHQGRDDHEPAADAEGASLGVVVDGEQHADAQLRVVSVEMHVK